jgi:hypothetical protein
MKVTKQK